MQHCELWSCVYSFQPKQEGKDFCGSGAGPDSLPSPSSQHLEMRTAFCRLCSPPLPLPAHRQARAALFPSATAPLPAPAEHSGLSSFIIQGNFQIRISAAACTITYACPMSILKHLWNTAKWSLLGSPSKQSMHFPKEILKNLWTPNRQSFKVIYWAVKSLLF